MTIPNHARSYSLLFPNFSKLLLSLAMVLSVGISYISAQSTDVEKKKFYQAMASNSLEMVETELSWLEQQGDKADPAFVGTMMMKRSGLMQGMGEKLAVFKEGRLLLEDAIKAHPENAEYRFLRLMIQERAPAILGYKNELEVDSTMVTNAFEGLASVLKQAIKSYSKESEILDFN